MLEEKIREAIVRELQRQAELSGGQLTVEAAPDDRLRIGGTVDLEALAMAVAGTVAGGP